jgi:hypothetical protein
MSLSWLVVKPCITVSQRTVRLNLHIPESAPPHDVAYIQALSDEWLLEAAIDQYGQDMVPP